MRALHIPRPVRQSTRWAVRQDGYAPRVAANPPVITVGTAPTLARPWPAGSGNISYPLASHPVGGCFTFSRGVPAQAGPTLGFVPASTVTTQRNGARAPSGQQFSFIHDGDAVELQIPNNPKGVHIRVDSEFVSLDPLFTGANAVVRLDFGSRATRRIDLITYKGAFAGVQTGPHDAVWAAPVRGPRTICLGDSFSTPDPTGWTNWFADALGWDDVWTSGVGGTGYTADASGLSPNWQERLDADVIAYDPEVVFLFGSVNDIASGPQAVAGAVTQTVSRLRAALPDAVIAGGMNSAFGVEYWTSEGLEVLDAAREAFTQAGGAWMSVAELPQSYSGGRIGNAATLMDPVLAGRPGNAGTPDTVAGAAGFRVNTSSTSPNSNLRVGATVDIGSGATRERVVITASAISGGRFVYGFDGALRYAHAAGEPVREVPPALFTGTGTSVSPSGWGNADIFVGDDGYHPNAAGHRAIGIANATMLADHLRTIGRA